MPRTRQPPEHWFDRLQRAYRDCQPLKLTPGEVASLRRALFELEIDTAEQAQLRSDNAGRFRSNYESDPVLAEEFEKTQDDLNGVGPGYEEPGQTEGWVEVIKRLGKE